jgi:hypothetical protein
MPDEITNDETTTNDDTRGQNADQANGDSATPDLAALRKEAAGHRRKLREAEAERDRLAGIVHSMLRNEVERRAEQRMHRGDDIWSAGVELGELLDEDGALDLAKVDAAVERVIKERPHWSRLRPTGAADQGARGSTSSPGITWQEALRP